MGILQNRVCVLQAGADANAVDESSRSRPIDMAASAGSRGAPERSRPRTPCSSACRDSGAPALLFGLRLCGLIVWPVPQASWSCCCR